MAVGSPLKSKRHAGQDALDGVRDRFKTRCDSRYLATAAWSSDSANETSP